MQNQHLVVQLKRKDKFFKEFSSKMFYEQYEQVLNFFTKCREIRDGLAGYSRYPPTQEQAKNKFNNEHLPALKKLATTPALQKYIEDNYLGQYTSFMGFFNGWIKREPTQAMLGFSRYKCHVSLSPESYQKHQKIISELLMNAIKDGTIPNFKYTQSVHLNNKLIQLRQLLKSSQDEAEKAKIRENISRTERLINGDQFTIYIPANVDIDKLADLCSKINQKLTEVNAIPGQFAAAESELTTFISFRQEYGLDDYGNECYIEATNDSFKEYQETSELYNQLKTKISETESHEISETESHEISETESHEISEIELQDIIGSIQKQINSIKHSQRYCFFRKGTEKIQALETLILELEKLKKGDRNVTKEDILAKIKKWESNSPSEESNSPSEESKSPPDGTQNYRQIIQKHRLGREDHSNLTKSDIMLIKIKEKLSPKPE